MVRLKDIAEHVGVSISTVSRVIKNDRSRSVHPDTRKKVWDAVKELGYVPNLNARSLVTGKDPVEQRKRTMKIGWVANPKTAEMNPYYSSIYSGISDTINRLEYTLVNINKEDLDEDSRLLEILHESGIEGLILLDALDQDLVQFIQQYIPVVGLDYSYTEESITVVDFDRIAATKKAVGHLIKAGHTQIGFIGGGVGSGNEDLSLEKRYQGFRLALEEAGISFQEDWVMNTYWSIEQSYLGMQKVLKQEVLPTAMFCASDLMAIAAMRAVYEHGLRIPEDIAFIGFDNIEMAKYSTPPLTTINIPKYEMGEIAAKTVIDMVEKRLDIPIKILLPFELIIRESC